MIFADYHIKRALALRKSLMIRREKSRKREMKVQLAQIEQDRSRKKRASHIRLLALLNEVNVEGIVEIYKKSELVRFCTAYGVRQSCNWNKTQLASSLAEAIRQNEYVPFHQSLSIYTIDTNTRAETSNGIPVIRLRRL